MATYREDPIRPYPLLGGRPVELLHFSHLRHVSLVQWGNRLVPDTGGSNSGLGVQPTLLNWDHLLALSCYRHTLV